jgi:hypothetical protein
MKTFLWTWDYRMRWAPEKRPAERVLGGAPYPWGRDTFVEDYRRLIDTASAAHIDAVVVWGFLRDSHGGQGAAWRVMDRARAAGVRLIPGVGVCAYGGVYWEGEHRYSLENWLRQHPDLAGVDADGNRMLRGTNGRKNSVACPSKEANVEWMIEGLRWLCENFDIGGIEFQTGDEGVCQCPECQKHGDRSGPVSFDDMERLLPPLVEEVRRHHPDAWIWCATSVPLTRDRLEEPPLSRLPADDMSVAWFIDAFPGYAAQQKEWDFVATYRPGDRAPTGHDIGMLPYNSLASFDEGVIHVERLHQAASVAREAGFEGLMTFGELGGLSHRINYAALATFARKPEVEPRAFLADLGKML